MSRRDMFTSVLVRELYDVYLKISRHTYDIGIIVDLIPVSAAPREASDHLPLNLADAWYLDVVNLYLKVSK